MAYKHIIADLMRYLSLGKVYKVSHDDVGMSEQEQTILSTFSALLATSMLKA